MMKAMFMATLTLGTGASANTILTCESTTQPWADAVVFRGPNLKPVYAGFVRTTGIGPIEVLSQGRVGHGQQATSRAYGSKHFSIDAADQRLLYVKGYSMPFKCKEDLFANIFPL